MGRRCPFLEPQGDESSEEWRRPGEKGRKQEGREERARWGERREEKTLGGQHRPRAGDWVKGKRKAEAAWEMGRPLPTCTPKGQGGSGCSRQPLCAGPGPLLAPHLTTDLQSLSCY